MRMVAAGDLTDAPGAEIVLLEGCEIRLLDSHGKVLGAATAPFGFTDVTYVPGLPRGHVLLGSSPNGDDNVYRLQFDAGWEEGLGVFESRGFMANVEENSTSWLRQSTDGTVNRWSERPPYDVVIDHHMWSGPDLRSSTFRHPIPWPCDPIRGTP